MRYINVFYVPFQYYALYNTVLNENLWHYITEYCVILDMLSYSVLHHATFHFTVLTVEYSMPSYSIISYGNKPCWNMNILRCSMLPYKMLYRLSHTMLCITSLQLCLYIRIVSRHIVMEAFANMCKSQMYACTWAQKLCKPVSQVSRRRFHIKIRSFSSELTAHLVMCSSSVKHFRLGRAKETGSG